ncbi:UbiA prenyltransferase family protein [Candidatus Methanocrinis natronophilus]|uniref:UbiA family prenyltransferase n=1 Tax=Candidatus Methanocrinis natronophilus TaxID=3033396 RepID=A0ABT5X7Q1_9EURY|nr:UbiA family prenyltransferase [Candidatus Methanocrinis natronophilus]MDF0590607.1 UbiA family prenyltransferase [Candidatus Methanocrinis natronophilus]
MIDYLRMLRIKDWIKFYPLFPLLGAYLAGGGRSEIMLVLIAYMFIIGYAFVVNNYYDAEIDRQHRGKVESGTNPLAMGRVDEKGVLLLMSALVSISLFISLWLDLLGAAFVVLNLLVLTAYSARRIRLKERYLWDMASHGLMFGTLPFISGFVLSGGDPSRGIILISLLVFIVGCEALIAHQIVDYAEDVESTTTTVTRIGEKNGLLMLGGLAALSLVFAFASARFYQLSLVMTAASTLCLVAYPAYSLRGMLNDIGHRPSAERGGAYRGDPEVPSKPIPGKRELRDSGSRWGLR